MKALGHHKKGSEYIKWGEAKLYIRKGEEGVIKGGSRGYKKGEVGL